MRILLLSSWFPYPPDNGSRIRAYNILKTIAGKHEVSLVSFSDPDFSLEHADALQEMCREIQTTPRIPFQPGGGRALGAFLSSVPRFVKDTYSPAMQRLVDDHLATGEFDVLFAGELSAAIYVRSEMPVGKIFDDLEIGIFHDAYALATGLTRRRRALTWWKMARYLQARAGLFDAVTVVSRREKELALKIGVPEARLSVLPNAIDCSRYANVAVEQLPGTLIYTGALTYDANLDAMRYFVREILPLVREVEPDTRLTITGRASQVAQNELSIDNAVLFAGYVADVRPRIAQSRVCVVPLRFGGGTRLKILEAMAVGTPVVSTSKGIEGLDLVPGKEVLVGDTPQDFARETLALLKDAGLRDRIAANGRAKVNALYDWGKLGKQIDALINHVTHSK